MTKRQTMNNLLRQGFEGQESSKLDFYSNGVRRANRVDSGRFAPSVDAAGKIQLAGFVPTTRSADHEESSREAYSPGECLHSPPHNPTVAEDH